ncbi:hypothetical protein LWI28_024604 [Acer negundo]|uniref:Disease resistance protein n=1 Tax=Acer negundo TaxID=4023 RepID=A0AAD5IMY6_ACENE|nr:hypothetical protein LWI28_024604 [Acer negundo]
MHDFSTADWFDMHDFSNDRFVMHDLINDLAQWAAKDFCTRIENLQEGEKQWKISENLCHLACLIDRPNYDNFKESGAFNKMKSVRTFLALSPLLWFHDDFNDFLCMVLQLRCLRVLSLKLYPIIKLPNSVGDMKLLHHLDLSYTKIEFLPDSINKLHNLEELILRKCRHLKRLCSDMGNLFKLRHLNVSGVDQLEAMPLRIGKLTSLRTLQRFVVGKDMRSGLKELKDLKHLQERLHISGLENVNDFVDAEIANLNGKDGLKDIQLEWTSSNDVSNEKEITAQVLEKLRPCQKLESLHIRGYRGTRFPRWLGHTSLSSLVSLTFEDCKNYASFPSIGQLSSLKKLVIRNINGIESLGQEFYGHGYYSRAPFESLEEFTIESLQDWKDWFPGGFGGNVEAFPRLQKLSIRKCSKLEGKLPEHLRSLKSLLIDDCEQWMVSVPRLPEDCTIQIANCKEVVLSSIKDCSSLSSMVHLLSGISSRMFLAEGFAQGFSKVEKLDIVAYDEPTSFLKSGNYSLLEFKTSMKLYFKIGFRLSSSDEEMLQQQELPGRCQYLILEDCQDPVKLEQALQSLSFLRGISIKCSKEIKFFPETGLPSQLRFIDIDKCDALQSLPMAWMHSSNTNLEELSVRFCDSLTCIDRVQLPTNLKQLVIGYCSNLLSVLDEEEVSGSCNNTSCLEHLIIYSCPSLTSLWSKSNELPNSLRYLSIRKCSKLESIAECFHDNTKLEELYIVDCMEVLFKVDVEVIYWIVRVPSQREGTTEYALKNCALCVHINDGCEIGVYLVQGVYKSSCHDGNASSDNWRRHTFQ